MLEELGTPSWYLSASGRSNECIVTAPIYGRAHQWLADDCIYGNEELDYMHHVGVWTHGCMWGGTVPLIFNALPYLTTLGSYDPTYLYMIFNLTGWYIADNLIQYLSSQIDYAITCFSTKLDKKIYNFHILMIWKYIQNRNLCFRISN